MNQETKNVDISDLELRARVIRDRRCEIEATLAEWKRAYFADGVERKFTDRLTLEAESAALAFEHYRMAGTCGMGYKPNDLQGAWACFACHQLVDSTRDENIRLAFAEGVMRTQGELLRMRLVKV